jgi:4-deoxy-L-threo-5-hexosulose-uronate ketol-isomerase
MQTRYASSPKEVAAMNTAELRENFLIESLMEADKINFVYSHFDRVVTGGAMPIQPIALPTYNALKSDYFLERREMGAINIGGDGVITADGKKYPLSKLDCLYLGLGTKDVVFESVDAANPAQFVLLSTPAHRDYTNKLMKKEDASPVELGAVETANQRTIYKYIHSEGLRSCQLVMGLTVLKTGSVWNTMPAHVHDRRMEIYFYFDVPENHAVVHFMGQPQETRHMFIANHQAIISPPYSIHSGCGTSSYSFIWAMAGENYTFTDMDFVEIKDLR